MYSPTYQFCDTQKRTAYNCWLAVEMDNAWQRHSDEDGRRDHGKEDLFELDGEVEITSASFDRWSQRLIVETAREVHSGFTSALKARLIEK